MRCVHLFENEHNYDGDQRTCTRNDHVQMVEVKTANYMLCRICLSLDAEFLFCSV